MALEFNDGVALLRMAWPRGIIEMAWHTCGTAAAADALRCGALHELHGELELGFADRLVSRDRALDEARRLAAPLRAAPKQGRCRLLGDLGEKLAVMQSEGYGAFLEYWLATPCWEAREQMLTRLGGG